LFGNKLLALKGQTNREPFGVKWSENLLKRGKGLA